MRSVIGKTFSFPKSKQRFRVFAVKRHRGSEAVVMYEPLKYARNYGSLTVNEFNRLIGREVKTQKNQLHHSHA